MVKQLKVGRSKGWLINTIKDIRNGIPSLISQIHSGETMQGHVCNFLLWPLDTGKLLHRGLGPV